MENTILKAYKFRIYPYPEQCVKLNQTFGCVRFVWNQLVSNFNAWAPDTAEVLVSEKTLKDCGEFSWLNDVSAASLQSKRRDFEEAKRQFFNKQRKTKIGTMQFKKKIGRQAYRLPSPKFSLDEGRGTLRLEKIGHVPVTLDRKIPEGAGFRSVTVSKTPTGKYFASILVKVNADLKKVTGAKVGIDLGLKELFALSDGQFVSNPRWFRESQAKLKTAQQHLSRKSKGSNRYSKQRMKVARLHEKVSNQRNYFLHNFSTAIVRNYDVICVEDLDVKGMVKNPNLAKAIHDASWASFVSMLSYKCTWYGKSLVKVGRFYPSSKTCSACGFKVDTLPLSVRVWQCQSCKATHDRDLNAAKNILFEGFLCLTGMPLSAESVDYRRRGGVNLFDASHHLGASVTRPDKDVLYHDYSNQK